MLMLMAAAETDERASLERASLGQPASQAAAHRQAAVHRRKAGSAAARIRNGGWSEWVGVCEEVGRWVGR